MKRNTQVKLQSRVQNEVAASRVQNF